METRINKYLSEVGFCSRREADKLLEQGRITINGKKPELGTKVSDADEICVDGKNIKKTEEKHVYIAFNKPIGIVCTTDTKREKNNIVDYINHPKRIFPIGRLDKPSEGLILLTSDGDIVNKILRARNNHEKEYIAEIKIGVQTESYDTEKPEILHADYSHITEDFIQETLAKFVGEIEQKPPVFSAIKIDGNRAYDLARAGQEVEMKSRKTTIHYLNNIEIHLPFVTFTVGCSKGTYIRSLAHDIGQSLGVGAYLTQLRRTKIGEYHVENAHAEILENEFRFSD